MTSPASTESLPLGCAGRVFRDAKWVSPSIWSGRGEKAFAFTLGDVLEEGNVIEIPPWLSREAWDAFVEMRRAKGSRAPLTPLSAKRLIFELDRLRAQGHDPTKVVWRSATRGWSGWWPDESTKVELIGRKEYQETQRWLKEEAEHSRRVEAERLARKAIKKVM